MVSVMSLPIGWGDGQGEADLWAEQRREKFMECTKVQRGGTTEHRLSTAGAVFKTGR